MNRDTLVVEFALLLTANTVDASHSGQFFCLWFTKNLRYYSNFWFICSVFLSFCGWKNVNNLVLIPNIQFNFLVSFVANCGPLSNITLSGNLCNFHILSLNNCTSSSTNILLLLPQNMLFWITYHRLLELHPFQLLRTT